MQASQEWGIYLQGSYMVGDGVMDVVAGAAVGARTIFVSPRKCYICDALAQKQIQPDYIVADLPEAAALIKDLESGDIAATQRFISGCTDGRQQRQ